MTIHVAPSPAGSDANDGTTPQTPVATLSAAQSRAKSALATLGKPANIDIQVAGGQYTADGVRWTLTSPGHRIQLAAAAGQSPIFTGTGTGAKYWLEILTTAEHGSTVFDVRGMTVRGYSNGLRLSTGYQNDPAKVSLATGIGPRLTDPVITGMTFDQIGSAHLPGNAYSAVHLQNTSGATVTANTFTHIENTPATSWLIHGVYAVTSVSMTVAGNDFSFVSGDPVRTRHRSSGTIQGNRFTQAGKVAAISDWYCGTQCARQESQAPECPPGQLAVGGNVFDHGYAREAISQFAVITSPDEAAPSC